MLFPLLLTITVILTLGYYWKSKTGLLKKNSAVRNLHRNRNLQLLFFSTPDCNKCTPTKIQLNEIAENKPGLKITEIDLSLDDYLAKQFHIRSVPTILIVDENRNEIARSVGLIKKEQFLKVLNEIKGELVNEY